MEPSYILLTLELLDVLPLATLYAAFGMVLYLSIAFIYPIYITYRVTCGQRRHKAPKEKNKEKPNTKVRRINQWIAEKVNTIVFTLYGESDKNITAFLKKESQYGVKEMDDNWRQTQLSWLALMLRLNAFTLLMSSLLALWERFLIERTIECDDKKICFIGTTDATRGWQRTPITSCDNVTETDRIICFEFVYSVGDAVGLAGGTLTYGIYTMKFGGMIILACYKVLKRCCNQRAYRLIAIIIQQSPVIILLVAAALSMAFVRYRDFAVYGTFIEAFGIASIFVLVVATPWSVLVNDEDEKKPDVEGTKEKEGDDSKQEHNQDSQIEKHRSYEDLVVKVVELNLSDSETENKNDTTSETPV
ncbi:uncharacterized protein LOC135339450 [Halichondria panicea]|uniref:uncharacterized protein LOC135339450 n=1 Tax=Halichondria panicea TaxID=6063 RepID=UPI00312B2C26